MTEKLNDIAEKFQVHPRTILRAIYQEPNPYWTEDHNPDVNLLYLARAYQTTVQALNRVLKGDDVLLTPNEAAEFLGIKPRTFRNKKYACLRSGSIVRYLRSHLISISI